MAPRGVPAPIVDRIRSLFVQAVADPAVAAKLSQIGVQVELMGADELKALLPKTRENIRPLLKELGLAKLAPITIDRITVTAITRQWDANGFTRFLARGFGYGKPDFIS